MNEIKKACLTFITINQKELNEASNLAKLIRNELGVDWQISSIEFYYKFEQSFKIDLDFIIKEEDIRIINNWGIYVTDKIVSPWLVYYDDTENKIELIFNANQNSKIKHKEFNILKWGHFQIT